MKKHKDGMIRIVFSRFESVQYILCFTYTFLNVLQQIVAFD